MASKNKVGKGERVVLRDDRIDSTNSSNDDISDIVGLGLYSDYSWKGEDLAEALRSLYGIPKDKLAPDSREQRPSE